MSYELYRLGYIGYIYPKDSEYPTAGFNWPEQSKPFQKYNLNLIYLESRVKKIKEEVFIGYYDSIEEIKQWLVEEHFELFL